MEMEQWVRPNVFFFRRDASTDMQHDLYESQRDLMWPGSGIKSICLSITFTFVNMHIYFVASRQDENDGDRVISLAFLDQK